MSEQVHTGRCFCGGLQYRVTGAPRDLCYCHCRSCRHAAGAPLVAWGSFVHGNFTLLRGELVQHRASPQLSRGFCAVCGTTLTYRHDSRPTEVDITLVSLDDAAGLAPACHIWVQDKLPWFNISDGLPQFATVATGMN